MSEYKVKIADLYITPIGNVKKLMHNFFDEEKYVLYYEDLQAYLKIGLKLKKIYRVLEFNQWQWLKKQYIEFNTQKRGKQKKWRQRWKSVAQVHE